MILIHKGNDMAWNIGFDDGSEGWIALPFEGWDTNEDTLAYLRGYYAGKEFRKIFGLGG